MAYPLESGRPTCSFLFICTLIGKRRLPNIALWP